MNTLIALMFWMLGIGMVLLLACALILGVRLIVDVLRGVA